MNISFLAPLSFALILLALPILVMYMLKLRRREVLVSSTLLWQAVLRDRQANTPWQKLRRNLLLFLQLLILAALIFSLARPAIPVPSLSSGSLVVLLDASASMNATDVKPTRFEAARAAVRTLIDGLPANAHMTLILASTRPVVLASAEADRTELQRALENAQPTQGEADWATAFALAAGASTLNEGVKGSGEGAATTVVVSDGALPDNGLPPLPGEVRFLPVGTSNNNLSITALSSRPAGEGIELFAGVRNYSDRPRQVLLSFYRNGELIHARSLNLAPQDEAAVSLGDQPPGEAIYQARLEPPSAQETVLDDFPLDDNAFAVNQGGKNRRVLVISKGNFFLEQVLSAIPDVSAYRALPSAVDESGAASIRLPKEPFDLYVLDGILPTDGDSNLPVLPEGNLLLINPPANALFSVTGTFTNTQGAAVSDHLLTQFVDWENVNVAKARHVQLPAWAEALVITGENPLVFAGETQGRRVAVLTFDLHDSDLPLQVTFPILFSSLIQYLAPAQAVEAPENMLPGEQVTILPGPDVQAVAVASPLEVVTSLPPDENGLKFSETGELGVYAVSFLKEKEQTAEYFAVNLFSEIESDIQPKQAIQVGRSTIHASAQENLGKREAWPWIAALALGLLLVEWWIYHRRQSLSSEFSTALQSLVRGARRKLEGRG
jgi:Ca-activated chloride channel homolog